MLPRVQLRETGGVAGLERSVALEGNTLRILDRGGVSLELEVPSSAISNLVNLVKTLAEIRPRRHYGRAGYAADVMKTKLQAHDDSTDLEVEVIFDPSDPAPFPFWVIVNQLHKLGKSEASIKTEL